MVPVNVGGVAVLLLIVVPGLHYELSRDRQRSGGTDSTFIEISRVLLAGLLLSGVAFLLLGVIRLVGPSIVVDPHRLLAEKRYLSDHLPLAFWSASCFLALALTCGSYMAIKWPSETGTSSAKMSAWVKLFATLAQEAANRQKQPFSRMVLQVTLKDGQTYRGDLAHYSRDMEHADRELVLAEPMEITVVGGQNVIMKDPANWHLAWFPISEISYILVLYTDPTKEQIESLQVGEKDIEESPERRFQVYRRAREWIAGTTAFRRIQKLAKSAYDGRTNPAFLRSLLAGEFAVILLLGLVTRLL